VVPTINLIHEAGQIHAAQWQKYTLTPRKDGRNALLAFPACSRVAGQTGNNRLRQQHLHCNTTRVRENHTNCGLFRNRRLCRADGVIQMHYTRILHDKNIKQEEESMNNVPGMVYCTACGRQIYALAPICPACGAPHQPDPAAVPGMSPSPAQRTPAATASHPYATPAPAYRTTSWPKALLIILGIGFIICAGLGALAAIALPAYSDYHKRTAVLEALELASGAKASETEFYSDKGRFPTTFEEEGIDPSVLHSGAVQGFTLDPVTHAIVITFNSKVNEGGQLLLTPSYSNNTIYWTCSVGPGLNPAYAPSNCLH